MFPRTLSVPVVLVAAAGLPYAVSNAPHPLWNNGAPSQEQVTPVDPSLPSLPPGLTAHPQGPGNPIYSTTTPLEGIRSIGLSQVLRFDISKEWVYQNWARKSTSLAELDLYGIRVPLVTGTQLSDLAGSLTYYFDARGQVERISFRGNTGDTTELLMMMTQVYGLQRQPTMVAGEQLLQIRRGADVLSECKTRPAPVLWSNSPHDSFAVELELQRPGVTTALPHRELPPTAAASQQATPPPLPPQSQEIAQNNAEPAQPESTKKEGKEKWDVFFPRSRVPKVQVENLEKRGRFW